MTASDCLVLELEHQEEQELLFSDNTASQISQMLFQTYFLLCFAERCLTRGATYGQS
jgi:hypothetical protein